MPAEIKVYGAPNTLLSRSLAKPVSCRVRPKCCPTLEVTNQSLGRPRLPRLLGIPGLEPCAACTMIMRMYG